MARLFIVIAFMWITAVFCVFTGFNPPTALTVVSYALNAVGCILGFLAFSHVVLVTDGESGESKSEGDDQ